VSHRDIPAFRPEDVTIPVGHRWTTRSWIFVVIGVIATGASFVQRGSNPEQFAFSWLVAFAFWLSIALGALFFVLTHYATRAKWSVVVRRVGEHVMATLPLFIIFFVPVYLGRHELYHWLDAEYVAHDALLQGKQGFLNEGFFTLRAAAYLIIWSLLAWWFLRGSYKQDQMAKDDRITKSMIRFSAPALIVFAVTVTFASVDWLMSLNPHWYSTMYGVYYFCGCVVGFFAFMCILTVAMRQAGLLGGAVSVEHLHDLGKMLFAFTVFWAYIAFSQYFLIWYANIPEETVFYLHRAQGGWEHVSMLLAVGHFAVPFFFLMSRSIKRRGYLLVIGSLWMLLMHLVDVYWLVMPTLHHEVHFSALDVTCLIGIGGLFVGAMGLSMRRGALVPLRDPRLDDSLGFENF
jgi:hypothetical protein